MCKNKQRRTDGINTFNIKSLLQKAFITMIIIAVALNNPIFGNVHIAKASSVSAVPDYVDETVDLKTGPGQSSKFYVSLDNKKTWEQIDAGKLDISSMLSSRKVTIFFKGNRDTDIVNVDLPGEDSSFKPVYKVAQGLGRVEFTSALPVQYRKGNGSWMTAPNPVYTAMYETKGTTLFFRTAPTTNTRAGKIVSVRIPKRPTAPSIKLDGSKMVLSGIKSGETQYRVGDNLIWTTFSSATNARYLDISALLGGSTKTNLAIPAGIIEFRTPGSDKKATSAVRVVEVPGQAVMVPSVANLSLSTVVINDSDTKKAYEYTVVKQGYTFDMASAKWSTVTSARAVVVPRVSIGDKVLVRVKSTTDRLTNQVILASTYVEFTVSGISQNARNLNYRK